MLTLTPTTRRETVASLKFYFCPNADMRIVNSHIIAYLLAKTNFMLCTHSKGWIDYISPTQCQLITQLT